MGFLGQTVLSAGKSHISTPSVVWQQLANVQRYRSNRDRMDCRHRLESMFLIYVYVRYLPYTSCCAKYLVEELDAVQL